MNTDTRKKRDFEKHFIKMMDNAIFEKTMQNARKQRI